MTLISRRELIRSAALAAPLMVGVQAFAARAAANSPLLIGVLLGTPTVGRVSP